MKYEEVSKSVVFAQNEYGANLVCIALENELIFVEAGLHTVIAANFRKAMEAKFNRKASTLLLSHSHIDHFFGMDAFSDLKVVAAEAGKLRFERIVNAEFTEEIIENFSRVFPHFRESVEVAKPFLPNVWVQDKMILGEENQQVVFQVVGGHSGCSSSIHYVPDGVMIVGDLVQVDLYPYFGEPDTDIEKWIHALKTWESMDIKAVLPGHGKFVTKDYLLGVRTFFEGMLATLKELKAEGVPIEEVIHHSNLPSGYWGKDAIRKPPYDMSIANLYKKL
ncbi:MAG: MBL fold metallo-hydrolase [Promethearchaeota archaeon]